MSSSGWIKMKDPNTGMDYYANRITRQTQWEVPPGFVQQHQQQHNRQQSHHTASSNGNGKSSQYNVSSSGFGSLKSTASQAQHSNTTQHNGSNHSNHSVKSSSNGEDALSANWEQLYDKASGKYFYVDHVNKVTSWERPASMGMDHKSASFKKKKEGMATGFGIIPKTALDRNKDVNSRTNGTSTRKSNAGMMGRQSSLSSATSPSWQSYGANPPPSAFGASPYTSTAKHSTLQNDDVSAKYYHENKIDFTVQKVPNRLRTSCAACGVVFSPIIRRHHCRVCQDVFCDNCSKSRAVLPFGGEEFVKPVRVCDTCHLDVDSGNFFSMRRYLTPLQLYDGEDITDPNGSEFSSKNVCAALSGLSQDLESLLLDSTSFTEKVTIPADVLIPAICRHLKLHDTCDYAIKALSTLLSLGNIVGDNTFLMEVYTHKQKGEDHAFFDDIMALLDWSGSHDKTLALQEQTAQVLFYLTNSKIIAEVLRLGEERGGNWADDILNQCDIHRVLRSTLDHTTQTMSPSLQRWSAACICNLIAEDYRRTCDAINYAMSTGSEELRYESLTKELVSSGGVMILSSLVSSDDSDTRNYAMRALSATIETSREINIQLGVLREAYGIASNGDDISDTAIIDGIVSAGACSPLTQLLLSADDAVASMGCSFARSLVHPLLTNPLGSALPCYYRFLSVNPNVSISTVGNDDGLGTYRNAALQMASSDGILSALVHLISDHPSASSRSIDLKRSAMEILASITMTLSFWDSKIKGMGVAMEGNEEWEDLKHKLDMALVVMEEEGLGEAVVVAYSSISISSINTSRDSPASQLREAASLVMSATAASSQSIASYFVSCNVVARLISTAADNGYATSSARGQWSSRRLATIEAIAMILVQGWKNIQIQSTNGDESTSCDQNGKSNPAPLGLLLESLDAGIVPLISRLIDSRIEDDPDKSYENIRLKIALCHIIGGLFGIGQCDKSNIGFARIFEALGNTHYLIPSTVALLGSTITAIQQHSSFSRDELPIPALLEANLVALGSMCGSRYCSFNSVGIEGDKTVLQMATLLPEDKDVFSCQFEEVCMSACEIITKDSFLVSCLVGAFGEGSVMLALRLISAIAEGGPERCHQMLASSGILLPIADMLRDALVAGDYYIFNSCLSLTSACGPQLTSNSENSGIQSLRGCVQMLANVLTIDEEEGENLSQTSVLSSLKRKCVFAIERLSSNSGLWVTIVTHFIPCVSEYLVTKTSSHCSEDIKALTAGLNIIVRVISLPVHALTIAKTNLGSSLSEVICNMNCEGTVALSSSEVEELSLQILLSLTKVTIGNQRNENDIEIDALNAACTVLSRGIDGDLTAVLKTKLALEVVLAIVLDLEDIESTSISSSSRISAFVETVSWHADFIRKLCATLLHLGEMNEKSAECKIEPMYGSTILLFEGGCGGFDRSLDAAVYLFYRIAFYSTILESTYGEDFWQIFFLEDQNTINSKTKIVTSTASCAIFLSVLVDEAGGMCVPMKNVKSDYYQTMSLPLVRERLLGGLHGGVEEFSSMKNDVESTVTFRHLVQTYNIPQSCLGLCNSPLMLDSAFQVLEVILSEFSDILVESVVSDMISLKALFNLLSVNTDNTEIKTKPEMIRIFAAVTLSAAGKLGTLGPAVKRNGLRSLAVASLSTACLMEEQDSVECLAEDLTGDGSSISTLCLRAIVDILSEKIENEVSMQLSPSEAKVFASSLGKKLSSMVLDHFMKRENGEFSLEDGEDVSKLPEVVLLCALAEFQDSLLCLCNNGGLEALSLVASEGLKPAITALHNACKIDAELVLKVDGHISVMQVLAYHSHEKSDVVNEACMEFLAAICTSSKKAKEAVSCASECSPSISFASKCIANHATIFEDTSLSETTGDLLDTMAEKPSSSGPIEIGDVNIILSSITFLSCMTRIKTSRTQIIQDAQLEDAFNVILKSSPSQIIKFGVASFFSTLARYVIDFGQEGSQYSIQSLSSMLLGTFDPKYSQQVRYSQSEMVPPLFGDFSKMHHFNDNIVLATACTALEHMCCHMSKELLNSVLSAIRRKFSDMVKYEMKTTKKIAMKARNSGLVVCNLSSLLLLCATRLEHQSDLKNKSLLSDLLRVVLLDPGEKIVEGKKDNEDTIKALKVNKSHWNCCLMHCLQCLAVLSIEPLDINDVESWDEIMLNVESEVQVYTKGRRSNRMLGSTASKNEVVQLSTVAVLKKYWKDGFDSGIAIAAKKIVENLDLV